MKLRFLLKRFLLISILVNAYYTTQGQFLDTLVASLRQPQKFYCTVDFSKSFGGNSGTDVIGIKLGMVQNKRIYYGLGYYILNTDVVNDITIKKDDGADTIVPAQLKLRFFTINSEYVFYKNNRLQFGIPINIGYGRSYYKYFKSKGNKEKTDASGSMLLTIGASGQFKVIPWIGLGFGMGYATTLGTNKYNDRDFGAWIYNFGVKIYFEEIYNTVKDLNKKETKKTKAPTNDEGPQPELKD